VKQLEQIDTHNEYVIFLKQDNWDTFTPSSPRFTKVLADIHWHQAALIGSTSINLDYYFCTQKSIEIENLTKSPIQPNTCSSFIHQNHHSYGFFTLGDENDKN